MPDLDKDDALNDDPNADKDDAVETPDSGEDESNNDDDDKEEDDDSQNDDDNSDDDDSNDDDAEEEDKSEFKKAFTQIKGDTPEEYVPNLEEAYRQSSAEAVKLAKQNKESQNRLDLIMSAVAKDPALAKAINDATADGVAPPTVDPALLKARQDMNEQMDKDYKKFTELHPEIESDPKVQEAMLEEMAEFGEAARKKGKVLSMEVALNKAWISLGFDKDDSKETVLNKAKDNASKPKTNNANKKTGKAPVLTPDQIKVGNKFGLTEKQMLEQLSKKS